MPEQLARPIIITEITKYFHKYRLINIYFTWSPNAIVSKIQLEDFKKLQNILYQYSDFALCGDFNTPRGSIIFNKLSEQYKDNIPIEINSTIDQNLHIAKKLQIVVDGVFTTTRYTISDINVYNGLSDHCGILFNLSII